MTVFESGSGSVYLLGLSIIVAITLHPLVVIDRNCVSQTQQWSVYSEFEASMRARMVPAPMPASTPASSPQRLHVFFYADDALRRVCACVW